MTDVTIDEVEAVARAIAGSCYDSLAGKRTVYTTRDEYIVGAWTEYAPEARVAIAAYNATEGQTKLRADARLWRASQAAAARAAKGKS